MRSCCEELELSRHTDAEMMDIERQLDARQSRRMKSEARYLDRLTKREIAAEAMIGELNSGKLYVFPVGGRYREGTSWRIDSVSSEKQIRLGGRNENRNQ